MSAIVNAGLALFLGFPALVNQQQQGWPWWAWVLLIVAVILVLLLLWFFLGPSRKKEVSPPAAPPAVQPPPPAAYVATRVPEAAPPPAVEPPPPAPAVAVPEAVAATAPTEAPPLPPQPAAPAKPDDLKIVEGIGPKIASVLQAAGIATFAELARTDVGRLEQILQDAELRLADPGTWSTQARLAAAGKWAELQALQDDLKGGRRAE